MRTLRNCRNRNKLKHEILQGGDEWRLVTSRLRHVLKVDDIKFFSCPLAVVTQKTWQIMKLVNECISAEHGDIIQLPFGGALLDQPTWFRQAVEIVRQERAEHRRKEMEKIRNGR
jgi:hypothetical protein